MDTIEVHVTLLSTASHNFSFFRFSQLHHNSIPRCCQPPCINFQETKLKNIDNLIIIVIRIIHEWAMNNPTSFSLSQLQSQAEANQQQEQDQEEEEQRARCEWGFTLAAVISPCFPEVPDVLGAIELHGRLLATGGIARKIRIYDLGTSLHPLPQPASVACDFYICAPAKLSSLRFRPGSGGRLIAAGDYDGVVNEYDLDRRLAVSERDEHGGRRVWSVDYSADGSLAASGADDGTAQVWDPRCSAATAAVLSAGSPVCSVEFEKEDQSMYFALGSADKCAYVYDLRNAAAGPVRVLAGHRKTVTYVRFAGGGRVVTSSVDGCHRLWEEGGRELRAYSGHRNARSFVGMAVCRAGGLIGSGSESNEVFVYDLRWGDPIWVQDFDGGLNDGGFVSAVCWREVSENECALIAGGSNGVVKIFAAKRKEEFII